MHLEEGTAPPTYLRYLGRKRLWLTAFALGLMTVFVLSLAWGPVSLSARDVLTTLLGKHVSRRVDLIIWNIRFPQALAAVLAGAGLALSGVVMQSVLKNPLGSPFTLGISNAAAFGAALSVMFLGTGEMQSTASQAVTLGNAYATSLCAFASSLLATGTVLMLSRTRGSSPESMVLTGVALASLFTAGTMLLQYFADDTQLAAMVFWTFGDLARARWGELVLMAGVVLIAAAYFLWNGWNFNALDAGEETAASLGVPVRRVRLEGMLLASLVSSVIVALVGVIGFVGLVCPHAVRRIIGDDHRFLLPGSALLGALLLLSGDTVSRLALAPRILPVSILTSFLGAPMFIWLIARGCRR